MLLYTLQNENYHSVKCFEPELEATKAANPHHTQISSCEAMTATEVIGDQWTRLEGMKLVGACHDSYGATTYIVYCSESLSDEEHKKLRETHRKSENKKPIHPLY